MVKQESEIKPEKVKNEEASDVDSIFGDDDEPDESQTQQSKVEVAKQVAVKPEQEKENKPDIDLHDDGAESNDELPDNNSLSSGNDPDDEEEDDPHGNVIVAQYKSKTKVKSTGKSIFKFHLQNVVMYIDGQHFYVKELKASIDF